VTTIDATASAPLTGEVVPDRHIFVRFLPTQALNPNRRISKVSRRAVTAARKDLYYAVYHWILAKQAGLEGAPPPPFELAGVSIGLVAQQTNRKLNDNFYRPRDPANLIYACKPVFDALKDGGWIVDDDHAHMVILPTRFRVVTHWQDEGLDIRVRELWTPPGGSLK